MFALPLPLLVLLQGKSLLNSITPSLLCTFRFFFTICYSTSTLSEKRDNLFSEEFYRLVKHLHRNICEPPPVKFCYSVNGPWKQLWIQTHEFRIQFPDIFSAAILPSPYFTCFSFKGAKMQFLSDFAQLFDIQSCMLQNESKICFEGLPYAK